MQTRLQAAKAKAAAAAPAAVQPAPPAANTTNNTVSDAEPATIDANETNLSAIAEEEDDDEERDPAPMVRITAFGVPQYTVRPGRALLTPVHSQSERFPPGVLDTPRKGKGVDRGGRYPKPTEEDEARARWVRDSELAAHRGMARLTRTGTLIIEQEDSFPGAAADPDGHGLGSAFASPSSSQVRGMPTRVMDPATGTFLDRE
ncbi:hypothetical protein B0H15DRAFT_826030 [Mycena belliarum]|uniref:Uncharacterized protein n=1 Tax=Mycena belliarum TaxID=1033014 RepID=A0AAD6UAY1_9AGAR|nr:hypothetical protein B0H15DRAFT_826030 [Mycena belliae]